MAERQAQLPRARVEVRQRVAKNGKQVIVAHERSAFHLNMPNAKLSYPERAQKLWLCCGWKGKAVVRK
jgi:hypothetical protein